MNFNLLIIPTLILSSILFIVGMQKMKSANTLKSKIILISIGVIIGIPGLLFTTYYLHLFDNAVWFYNLRSISYIELSAGGLGLLAGIIIQIITQPKSILRYIFASIFYFSLIIPYLKPILAPIDNSEYSNKWENDICLQSTPSSCGAASSATIFRKFGENITEQDLAQECYTYRGGTENWYLSRAFRKRGYSVTFRFEDGFPQDLQLPVIAGIRVGNIGHFITIVDLKNGAYITGDPLKGREDVPQNLITEKFDFTGFFMEIKNKD